jgi:hypothetical protein
MSVCERSGRAKRKPLRALGRACCFDVLHGCTELSNARIGLIKTLAFVGALHLERRAKVVGDVQIVLESNNFGVFCKKEALICRQCGAQASKLDVSGLGRCL